jgi:hypothetical protein
VLAEYCRRNGDAGGWQYQQQLLLRLWTCMQQVWLLLFGWWVLLVQSGTLHHLQIGKHASLTWNSVFFVSSFELGFLYMQSGWRMGVG